MTTNPYNPDVFGRNPRRSRLDQVETQAVLDYRRALRAKLAAARALAVAKCGRDLDAAYEAMDEADVAIRRGLRTLNETLTMGEV